jgi:hypothetical protein
LKKIKLLKSDGLPAAAVSTITVAHDDDDAFYLFLQKQQNSLPTTFIYPFGYTLE